MTDLEKLKAVFTEIGVGFEERPGPAADGIKLYCASNMPGNTGYSASVAEFEFTAEGKFNQLGLWEE